MVPAFLRSKLAPVIALSAVMFVAFCSATASHRAASRAEDALAVRTEDLRVAVARSQQALKSLAYTESLRKLTQDSLRVEHEHRVAADARAAEYHNKFDTLARVAPDTCGPVVAAALDAIQSVEAADSALKVEFATEQRDKADVIAQRDSAIAALGRLRDAAGHEVTAAHEVVHPSLGRRTLSFVGHLSPKVGVGVAVGVDPMTNKPSKTAGLTFGWSF